MQNENNPSAPHLLWMRYTII